MPVPFDLSNGTGPGLTSFVHSVAAAIAHFIAVEIGSGDASRRFGAFADFRHGSSIPVVRMEMVIYVAVEMLIAVEPGAHTDKDTVVEPFGAIVAGGGTGVRGDIVVAVGAIRSGADAD